MALKDKVIGIILIIMGILPLLLKINVISEKISQNKILSLFVPGSIIYQIVIIGLGFLLIWRVLEN